MERPLGSVRPSQLYVDAAALRDVLGWVEFSQQRDRRSVLKCRGERERYTE